MAHDWQPDFEQLVDEHQSMVYSLGLRMTGDRGLAEEIAQDVFLELDKNLGKIESAPHLCFWLRRVTMSRSADALRRRKVRRMDQWVEIEEGHGVQGDEHVSPLGKRIEQLLATLPEPQRAALVLRYQEDLTPEELQRVTALESIQQLLGSGDASALPLSYLVEALSTHDAQLLDELQLLVEKKRRELQSRENKRPENSGRERS